ncbi:hypothetical protein GF373_05575 [bacterium]|nr:hypothetical protein [bacterium]
MNFPLNRRAFIKQTGAMIPVSVLGKQTWAQTANPWWKINSLADALTQDGDILLRIAFTGRQQNPRSDAGGSISIQNGKIASIKPSFFEADEDSFTPAKKEWAVKSTPRNHDVLLVRIQQARKNTKIHIRSSHSNYSFTLNELVQNPELQFKEPNTLITANLLLDKEIGEIDLRDVFPTTPENRFEFAVLADPQGGDPTDESNDSTTRLKIHNAFVEESIRLVNQLDPPPKFTLMLGDIVDSQGQATNYRTMLNYFQALKSPILWELGNHETRYGSRFTPGYNMAAFDNYFHAQKEINGMSKLLYSFNAGQWHFIVWPDPLRGDFWHTHPHYFDWLERDLEKYKDKPTMFFQHVPIHPIGINPLVNYMESVDVKRLLFDLLSRHGNVKYVLSGHVHIPVKASAKIARTYKGIKFINLPAAGYRPRNFGEEDYHGGPTQGIAIVSIRGKEASVRYQQVTGETFTYPAALPHFHPDNYPLWLTHKWRLAAENHIVNGGFEDGFKGWNRQFVYEEDKNPSNLCQIRRRLNASSYNALYLYCHKRGYDAPGQDRMPQHINQVCQAVQLNDPTLPAVKFSIFVEGANFYREEWNGAFVWLEGYEGSYKHFNLVYWVNNAYSGLCRGKDHNRNAPVLHYDITDAPNTWQVITLNPTRDIQAQKGLALDTIQFDRLVINLGVWTDNEGEYKGIGVYFDDFVLSTQNNQPSQVNEKEIKRIDKSQIWRRRNRHTAGEHKYI